MNHLVYYSDYDSEFALFNDECAVTNRSPLCSATHAVAADEMQCIAHMMDEEGKADVAVTLRRWAIAHALYGVLLAREGL